MFPFISVDERQNVESVNVSYLTNKEAQAVYYTVIKHDGHLRTRGKYVLYSNKTWVFDQSKHAQGPISIIIVIILHSTTFIRL